MRKIEELGWAVAVAVGVAVLGVGLGLAWYLIAPPLPVRKVEGGFAYIQPDPEQPVAADGWFAILGLIFGVLVALAVWAILRKARGPLQLAGLVLGAVGAGIIAYKLGLSLETSKYEAGMKTAVMEQQVDSPAKINAVKLFHGMPYAGTVFVPALGISLAYAVLAGWSRWPSLRPNEEPLEDEDDDLEDDDLNSLTGEDLADQVSPEPPAPPAAGQSPGSAASAPTEDGSPHPPR